MLWKHLLSRDPALFTCDSKVENHEMAKDLLAGFAGAEADKLFETHGLK